MARILLAEDDDNLREFLTRGLRRAGHTVLPAADGDSALNLLIDDDSVDLLLADVVMPGLDGIELARQATKRWPTLRVMFITGFAAVALRQREMGSRPATVLAKPFHLRQLVEEVERMLAA
ncbi:MAG TPA: response regulator [Stellaceae bacterium]|nr:response regulator [Stellaceae bacterium]